MPKPKPKPKPATKTIFPILNGSAGLAARNVGQYTGAEHLAELTFGKQRFKLCTYQAYNAMGLIGSEFNGIAILDDLHRKVVLDGHLQAGSGWNGVRPAVVQEFYRIAKMSWPEFREFVNAHPRARHEI